ncbi:MAG: nucleotidyl transferase AbiEii/AbiGii toxin family protein [Cyanobacteria bacterium]|nr:nucleotidyl transferase AbiEii/AbiGii toxin family protein [Cyanobacteriota bacterium]
MFEFVVRLLTPMLDEVVFVGGSTTGLLLTDPAAAGIRPTKDVDTIVNATSYAEYEALSKRLKALGLVEDTTEGAPLCRWRYSDVVIDVMPIDEKVLGFTNRWYRVAVESADTMIVAGQTIRVVKPVYFVATKLEAFHGRGADDVTLSHDLEDIIALIDGRAEIVGEIANATADVRAYIASEIRRLMSDEDFREAIPGFLLPDSASQSRRALLEGRFNAIAALN